MTLIPIDNELKYFKKYLDSNDRCIFSARFGDGKSYFLSRFMKKYQKQYLFIPIYPVNYQVADNKDIFEYIKRDILIRLLASGEVDIDDTTISNSIYLYYYLLQNKINVSSYLLNIAPDINLNGTDISLSAFRLAIKAFGKIKEKFEEYKSKFRNDEQRAEAFLASSEKEKGSIYEFDIISQLICDLIAQYKAKYKNRRKIVLLIEDLDRIDPEHIFRILNIFSAHFDRYDTSYTEVLKTQGRNKFNFDKIITVCHYENIENIYHHLYGEKTDFNGYIGKFSTVKPFQYSLESLLKEYVKNCISQDFVDYPNVCDSLAAMIVNKYKETTSGLWGNIRHIIYNLNQKAIIEEEYIYITKKLKVYTVNSLTKLLSLLHCFDLKWDILSGYYNKQANFELNFIIGQCWLCAKFKNDNIEIEDLENDKISLGYKGYATSLVVDIMTDNNILYSFPTKVLLNGGFGKQSSDAILAEREFVLNYFTKYLNNSYRHSILR